MHAAQTALALLSEGAQRFPRMNQQRPWVTCQLGSREHYAIPRVLHADGALDLLLTDFWARPGGLWSRLPGARFAQLRERFHPGLAGARVIHPGWRRLAFEFAAKRRGLAGWPLIQERNRWFQRRLLAALRRERARLAARPGVFFAYSYAARELLGFFRALGWRTVLGQIDPGPREEAIVREEIARRPDARGRWQACPPDYWDEWRREAALADCLAVNSPWSRDTLIADGFAPEKVRVLPLAFEKKIAAETKRYPEAFTAERPLRVLFLGQVNVRKGAHLLLDAAARLAGRPVEFWMVGPVEIATEPWAGRTPNVRWFGAVSRAATERFYRDADVFILPTLSDGFALTQLEAAYRGLPLIVSPYAGRVVAPGRTGWLIEPRDAAALDAALAEAMTGPERLRAMSAAVVETAGFALTDLRRELAALET